MAATALKLHCALERCWTKTVIAPSSLGLTAGQMQKNGNTVEVIFSTVKEGETTTAIFRAPMITLPCIIAGTGDYAVDSAVYYDESEGKLSPIASGNTRCGIVLEQPEVGATEVYVAFDGILET